MKENGEETGNLKEEKLNESQTKQENSSSQKLSDSTSNEPVDIPKVENGVEETDMSTENNTSPSTQEQIDSSKEDTAGN